MSVAWENYVYDCFRAVKNSPTQKRRRDLVFELTQHGDWADLSSVQMLTPNLAREYASAGDRMVQRDLNAVAKMGLIMRRHGKVKANKHIMQAFLPNRVNEQKK